MLRASKMSARVELDAIPLLAGARECLGAGLRSTFHPENAKARAALRIETEAAARPELDVVFDPQTSGGLLFGIAEPRAAEAVARLRAGGDVEAARIGSVAASGEETAPIEVC
jgi:selenide,water dikinase